MPEASTALSIYADLARQYGGASRGLPAQVDITPVKTVICFRVMGLGFAIPLEETAELLEVPPCTRLPRVKSWVRGVANVRGKLLPVIDFADFLGGRATAPPSRQRVIILDLDDLYVGLLVDEIPGMRHFSIDRYDAAALSDLEAIHPFVAGAFDDDGRPWFLMRPWAVVQDSRFRDVSI